MKTNDFSNLKNLTVKQLSNDHRLVHAYWSIMEKTGKPIIGGKNKEDLFNIHQLIVDEMKHRKLNHNIADPSLDKIKLPIKLSPKKLNLDDLHNTVLVPGFISLVGSLVEGKKPNDIDLLIKQKTRSTAIEKTLHRMTSENYLHFLYDPAGSTGEHIVLFDLVLVKRENQFKQTPEYEFLLFGPAPSQFQNHSHIFLHREGNKQALLDECGRSLHLTLEEDNFSKLKPDPAILELSETLEILDIWRWNTTELTKSSLTKTDREFFLDKCGIRWHPDIELSEESSKIELMKAFRPLKVRSGYGKFEFNDPEKLIENWVLKNDR